ncbi:peptidyl-prolyl cis-trans isomerase [Paraburkholderia sp. B3]|uniref:peptidylprolyl isomerase n=1 Tax=Paraburkholderia sp. B3 TaxID=3134791 RepID=UPI003982B4BA
MFRLNRIVHTARVAAFASLMAGSLGPSFAYAIDTPAAGLPGGAMAVVNGVAVPQSQLDDAVRAVTTKTGAPDTPQLRQVLKNELIVREVFRQNAVKAHYDQKPEVQQAAADAKVGTEIQLYLKDNIHPDAVTDDQVKARYDQIVASLGKEEFQSQMIVVPDAATAKTVLGKVKAGQPFDALAKEYSVAPSRANGGAMPWVSFRTPLTEGNTQGVPLPLAQAIVQLPVGGITPQPVQVGTAWAIVKLDAKRPTQIPAFDQAKDTVKQQLQTLALQKAAAQFTAAQVRDATIRQ